MSEYKMLLTARHSTAQHTDCALFSAVHKLKLIKASINMYMDRIYVFIGVFLSNRKNFLFDKKTLRGAAHSCKWENVVCTTALGARVSQVKIY